MLSSKPRSSSSSNSSTDSRPVLKMATFADRRAARVSDMQEQISQLQEELRKEKEAKFRAIDELEVAKNNFATKQNGSGHLLADRNSEKEMQRAKESERKMLESLVSQTKLLEQTKIALEEAKLEIKSLQESSKKVGRTYSSATWSSRNLESHFRNGLFSRSDDEVGMLRNELKLATEAEAKSKKAMDDLAIVLKEVTAEANQAKKSLAVSQSELETVRGELQQLKWSLQTTEERFRVASKECERLKLELEDSVASWNVKEKEFVNCVKMSDEENAKLKAENDKLFESQKSAREENTKLRDLVKQAVNEASVAKEALEIARKENDQLKDLLSEKENNLQRIKQEFECLKVSEAAAIGSVQELKSLLAATSTLDSGKESTTPVSESRNVSYPNQSDDFSSRSWNGSKPRNQNGRRHSIGEAGKFNGFASDMGGFPSKISSTLSNVSAMKVSSVVNSDAESLYSDDFYHVNGAQSGNAEQNVLKQKKKRAIFRRFGDMFRRTGS